MAAESSACSSCGEELPFDYVQCSADPSCKLHFHCAGVNEGTWRKKKKDDKMAWMCAGCKATPIQPREMRNFMKDVRANFKKIEELAELIPLVKQLEKSVEFLSGKYDEMVEQNATLDVQLKVCQSKCDNMENSLSNKEKIIEDLQLRIVNTEQYARNRNIEISGLPAKEKEDLNSIMTKMAETLNIQSDVGDIDVMHRVPTRSSGPPKIIVQFKTRSIREKWLEKRREPLTSMQLLDGVRPEENNRVYINRHLAEHWQKLLWKARQHGQQVGYLNIWYQDNKIIAKKNRDDRSRGIVILHESDLQKMVQ